MPLHGRLKGPLGLLLEQQDQAQVQTSHASLSLSKYPKIAIILFESTLGPFHMLECIQSGGFAIAWATRDVSTSRICHIVFQGHIQEDRHQKQDLAPSLGRINALPHASRHHM